MAPVRPSVLRRVVAGLVAAAVLVPLVLLWQTSRAPGRFAVTEAGAFERGSGPRVTTLDGHPGHADHGTGDPAGPAATVGVDDLVAPAGPADVVRTLTARAERVEIAPGRVIDAYTVDGTTPGPTLHATQGDLVEVTLVNESVPDGATLHWHGVDVPNGADGVAGVTQDAVPRGGSHTYRFVAADAGTYWYHSHQVSHEQVRRGLFGALVVAPTPGTTAAGGPEVARLLDGAVDVPAVVHRYGSQRTVQGVVGDLPVEAAPGRAARVRVINTDDAVLPVWVSGAAFRLLAIDGTDVHGPPEVEDAAVVVPAGGRADLLVVAPLDGTAARVELGGAGAVVVGPAGADATLTRRPATTLDPLTYGAPAPLGLDPADVARSFDYVIGRAPGFLDGRPGMHWTVNGHTYPDVPMFEVAEGEVVRMRIANRSGVPHPMHLHGHHVLVMSRDGEAASGSPWWTDSLEVGDGETYDVAFVADNPGIWMDHCHNLPHAAEGLVAHLAYEGVTTPYLLGHATGNEPE
ncbi:multicopper oxidase family protein [Isoptericola sp. 4D.3]|uniref:Multicopper oxidase family protein n=1 Tax=Isoptericola peretonis TaxID=2918523 RepID=A0ABT0J1Y9_9MICO|nr:multicopper oxidase family protein [Isoptericola sp. 4D.3]